MCTPRRRTFKFDDGTDLKFNSREDRFVLVTVYNTVPGKSPDPPVEECPFAVEALLPEPLRHGDECRRI